jgi:hypothetical protein
MLLIVRKDLDIVSKSSFSSTQEMFLAHVGIQNSFVEDNEMLTEPFFVSVS